MGALQSHESSRESLLLLGGIQDEVFKKTLQVLKERITKMQMQVSKWDLYMIMQISQTDIKKILSWMKNQEDPTSISTHLFIVGLILSRQNLSIHQKIELLIDSLCFQCNIGQVQQHEVRFIFNLVYQLLTRVCLKKVTDQEFEDEILFQVFKETNEDETQIQLLVDELSNSSKIQDSLKIVCQSQKIKITNNHTKTQINQIGEALESVHEEDSQVKDLESVLNTSGKIGDQKSGTSQASLSLTGQQKENSKIIQKPNPSQVSSQESLPQINLKHVKQTVKEVSKVTQIKSKENNDRVWHCEEQKNINDLYQQNDEKITEDKNLAQLELAQHFNSLKEKCNKEVQLDMITPLVEETEMILNENMKVFGSAQLVQLMISNQFVENFTQPKQQQNEKSLNKQKLQPESKQNNIEGGNAMNEKNHSISSSNEHQMQFGVCFKEFYQARNSEEKIELKKQKSQLITYLEKRGEKRIIEAKKLKTLGELQILQQIIQIVVKNPRQDPIQPVSKKSAPVAQSSEAEGADEGIRQSQEVQLTVQKQVETKEFQLHDALSTNELFSQLLNEFATLRNCGFSRKGLVLLMDLKNEKRQAERIVSFWQGVRKLLESGIQTFSTSDYLQQFLQYAQQKQITEEHKQRKLIQQHFQLKLCLDKFNAQIGKLKAYQFLIQSKATQLQQWLEATRSRIKLLQDRLSITDIMLVDLLNMNLRKKRSSRLYMTNVGRVSAYKCITKGLQYEHSIEYLAINLVKIRTWELVCLTCQDTRQRKTISKPIQDLDLLGPLKQMQRLQELYSKLENFKQFKEDVITIGEEERLLSEAPNIPQIAPLEQVKIERSPYENVKILMNKFYQRIECSPQILEEFQEFQTSNLQFATYDLNGTMSYQTLDIEDSGQLIFDFIELENVNSEEQREFINWLGNLSCSLRDTYFQAQIEKLRKSKSDAHKSAKKQIQTFATCNETNYKKQFSLIRSQIFEKFIQNLRLANKGQLINNFDMTTLSLPLEYSLMNNYWFIQSVRQHIRLIEKKVKFSQVQISKSCVLFSQRIPENLSKLMNVIINDTSQQQLQPVSAANNPLSQQSKEQTDPQSQNSFYATSDNLKIEEMEKLDWDRQFTMCKGLDIQEESVKFEIFSTVQEMIDASQTQIELEQALLAQVLQTKETMSDMKQVRLDLQKRYSDLCQIEMYLQSYRETKGARLEQIKKIAIFGVFRGAVKYLECLLECTQSDNQIEEIGDDVQQYQLEESHLDSLHSYLKHVLEQIQNQFDPTKLKIKDRNFPDISQYPGLQIVNQTNINNTTLNISVKKGMLPNDTKGNTKETPQQSPNKVSKKASKQVKKKKNKLKPYQQAEVNLIGFLAKKHYLIQLVEKAEKCDSLATWYEWCNEKIDRMQNYSGRLESAINYLQANSNVESQGEYQSIQEDELGCRMLQSVLIGAMVHPVHVYNPNKVQNLSNKATANETELNFIEDVNGNAGQQKRKGGLSKNQISANHLLQFINMMIHIDSKLTAKQFIKSDKLFSFLQRIRLQVQSLDSRLRIQNNITIGFRNWLNVYKIARTPQQHFISEYKNLYKHITRDAMGAMFQTDESLIRLELSQIVSQSIDSYLANEISTVDYYFAMTVVAESDKLDFGTASIKIKKMFDQALRTFKEMNALEENRKYAQSHFTVSENQERQLENQIASLALVVWILKIAKRITNC